MLNTSAADFSSFHKPSLEEIEKAQEMVNTFQKSVNEDQIEGIIKAHKDDTRPENIKKAFKDFFPNQSLSEEKTEAASCGAEFKKGEVYYFMSFSMPYQSIINVVKDAVKINKECKDKRVVLVLKGFVQGNLKATINEFYKLMKDLKFFDDIPLEINPELFEAYDITEVPVVIYSNGKSVGSFKGDVRLSYIIKRFEEEIKDYGKYGNLYRVKEKDILEIVKQKQGEIEKKLKERMEGIRKDMYVVSRFDGKFQKAKKDRVYHINSTVVLSSDIKDHNGNVLFPKGSVFKPSDYVSLGRYIVIDGNSHEQVQFAIQGNYRKIMLISGDIEKLIKQHKIRFYTVNETIIDRLKIEKVPAIIEQEGDYIRVTEKAL
jgi:conjugal transfer pilus assembly protein TraW